MEPGILLLAAAFASALFGLFCMIKIISYLSSKGEKVNWFLIRLKWFSYMSKYRELTTQETGEVGPYHRFYIISMLASLVLAITGASLLNQ